MGREKKVVQLKNSIALNRGQYAVLLGAGVSVKAGIPLATKDLENKPSIVSQIKHHIYSNHNPGGLDNQDEIDWWFQNHGWLQCQKSIYADALELIGVTPMARRNYLQRFFEGKTPTLGHGLLAELAAKGWFRYLFTTNFDRLVEQALRVKGVDPLVITHSRMIPSTPLGSDRPWVIKLHGDYLFSNIKNLRGETQKLEREVRNFFRRILETHGLIVVGYAGNDDSIMKPLKNALRTQNELPLGLLWILQEGTEPNTQVNDLLRIKSDGVLFIEYKDSDTLFHDLRDHLDPLRSPQPVERPLDINLDAGRTVLGDMGSSQGVRSPISHEEGTYWADMPSDNLSTADRDITSIRSFQEGNTSREANLPRLHERQGLPRNGREEQKIADLVQTGSVNSPIQVPKEVSDVNQKSYEQTHDLREQSHCSVEKVEKPNCLWALWNCLWALFRGKKQDK